MSRAGLGVALALLALGACDKETADTDAAAPEGPSLAHDPPEETPREGVAIPISVRAADDDGVASVTLYHRVLGLEFWEAARMETASEDLAAEGAMVDWTAEIPGTEVRAPGVEYYFKAEDYFDPPFNSYLPDAGASGAYVLTVERQGLPLPWSEGFEVPDEGGDDLYSMGWLPLTEGFVGYPWEITGARAAVGARSAGHARGYAGVPEMDDWLVSPPLDLSGLAAIEVTWSEYGASAAVANHSLWISTASPDPDDEMFTQVAALPAPTEGAWSRSAQIDLSVWSGAELAYLAWRYQGAHADDWYLDDVAVRPLGADIWDADFRWSPDPVYPGEAVTLTFTLENRAAVDSGDLIATLSLPDGGGALAADVSSVGVVRSLDAGEVAFELTIDGDWPNHSYLPVSLLVEDSDRSWTFERALVVGESSTGRLDVEVGAGFLEIHLGVGDPDAPAFEERIVGEILLAGERFVLEHDLTAYYAYLPPAAGPQRWYARVFSESGGQVHGFEIDYGLDTFASTVNPALAPIEETLIWLPEPVGPAIDLTTITPDPLTPGVAGATVSFQLSNTGAATSGAVTATLSSADPDVTLVEAGPMALTEGAWSPGEVLTAGPFTFDVAAGHVDSTDVRLTLTLDDGVEQWAMDVGAAVPWVVVRVLGVDIDDSDDGLLDPGEVVDLVLEISNTGALDSDGTAVATLALAPSSAVVATVEDRTESLGFFDVGDEADGRWEISVPSSASTGDALDLLLTVSDERSSYTAPVQVILGETPWLYLASVDDALGDAYGFDFDLKNARFRVTEDTFQLLMESHTDFDPDTAFIEYWIVSGGGDYLYFRAAFQSGTSTLQGYDAVSYFTTIYSPAIETPDARTIVMSWPVEIMAMSVNFLSVGMGAGWCSTETGNYCDHFPDAWGHYYTGFDSGDFFSIRW